MLNVLRVRAARIARTSELVVGARRQGEGLVQGLEASRKRDTAIKVMLSSAAFGVGWLTLCTSVHRQKRVLSDITVLLSVSATPGVPISTDVYVYVHRQDDRPLVLR